MSTNGHKNLMPLAMVGKGETLCTTQAQDQYFVVDTSGAAHKVDLLEACRLYLSAKKVVWSSCTAEDRIAMEQRKPQRSTEKWRRKMQEALQNIDNKSFPPKE